MKKSTGETVSPRLEGVERGWRHLRLLITWCLSGIAAVARAGLVCMLISIPWEGGGFGVTIASAQTEHPEEQGNTTGSTRPSLNLQDLSPLAEELLREKTPATPFEEKVHPRIREVKRRLQRLLNQAAPSESVPFKEFSDDLVRMNDHGEIQVYVILKEFSRDGVAQLEGLGLRVELTLPKLRLVQGWIRYDAIESLAADDNVQQVKPPDYMRPNSGAVNSEGDAVLRADTARSTFGVDGSGVKVCVISNGVDHLAPSVASGDLPSVPPVQILHNSGGDEGTAMLEIIHDLAPGAALAFYGAATTLDFIDGASTLQGAGCQVIVDDVFAPGEPKFEDGPVAQAVRQLTAGGIVYVTSAGNYAQQHYFSGYRRLIGQNFPTSAYPAVHNFSPGGTDIGDTLIIPPGGKIMVALQWNNPFGASADDFDLFLVRSDNLVILTGSAERQNGSNDPIELFIFTNFTGSPITAFIAIAEYRLVSNPSSIKLNYISFPINFNPVRQYVVPEESIFGHAAVNEVLSVAAVNAATPTTIASYSSRGPATIFFPHSETRNVSKITGVDGVQTQVGQAGFFLNPFLGTSAAAPHVAAIAALLWSAKPTLTSGQVVQTLTQTATDLGAPGFDTTYGFGRVDALQALASVDTALSATLTLSGSTFHTGEQITYQATLTPGSTPMQVDIYLGALMPDGVTFLSLVDPGGTMAFAFGPVPVPFARNVTLTPMVIPFSYTFGGTESVGTYYAYAGLAVAGSDPLQPANQLSLGVQAFQFAP